MKVYRAAIFCQDIIVQYMYIDLPWDCLHSGDHAFWLRLGSIYRIKIGGIAH